MARCLPSEPMACIFTNLHSFTALSAPFTGTNSDGANPKAGLLLAGFITLYGTAYSGGTHGNGTVFAINVDGTDFTNLHNFAAYVNYTNSEGANPQGGLIVSGNTLYGTTSGGGTNGWGMVFSLSLPTPQLTIIRSGTNVIVMWPTNALEFTLQSTTNLDPVWTTVVPGPVVVNTNNVVTNTISGTQKFYRLSL